MGSRLLMQDDACGGAEGDEVRLFDLPLREQDEGAGRGGGRHADAVTSVPPLVPGEHSRVIGRDWASATLAAARPASGDPAAATAAAVLLLISS